MKPDLILTDATIVSPGVAPIARGWLALSGEKIVDLGPMATLPSFDGRTESLAC